MAKMGRPSLYSDELAAEICQRIAEGETLVAICKDKLMPCYRTVLNWRAKKEDFFRLYVLARVDSADRMGDRIVELVDQVQSGELDAHAGRACIDGLKWLMAKLHPERYGDRIATIHSGSIELESVKDHAPDWLQKRLTEVAPDASAIQSGDDGDCTVH